MRLLVIYFLFFTALDSFGQNETVPEETDTCSQEPYFPGGEKALMQNLYSRIVYPTLAKENNQEGKVWVQYIINTDGSISDVTVVRTSGYEMLDQEAIRVIKTMPNWIPGKDCSGPIRVRYTLPIAFSLS